MAKSKKSKKTKKPNAGSKKVTTSEKDSEKITLAKEENAEDSVKKSETDTKTEKKSEKKTESAKASKKDEKKPSAFAKLAKYFRECRSEVKKIVWPTPKTTFKNVGIVLSVLLVVGLFVYGLDTGFLALLKLIMDI